MYRAILTCTPSILQDYDLWSWVSYYMNRLEMPTSGKCLVWYTRANANKRHKFHARNSQRPRAKVSTSSSERRENGSPVNEWNFNLCFSSALAATRYYERLTSKFVSKKILVGRAVAVGETRSFVFMTVAGAWNVRIKGAPEIFLRILQTRGKKIEKNGGSKTTSC